MVKDIPQDILEAATAVAFEPKVIGAMFSENYVLPIARAILAERQRCSTLADAEANRLAAEEALLATEEMALRYQSPLPHQRHTARRIAANIRIGV
jgi:hypothetical protein